MLKQLDFFNYILVKRRTKFPIANGTFLLHTLTGAMSPLKTNPPKKFDYVLPRKIFLNQPRNLYFNQLSVIAELME